ncbi:HNH endonuclease [Pedobacter sp. Leaf194]|uniref:HNH endonuclease n=1 Tax=Pedobacter sp. Leaf194 TaxID=1736297 RepID=UPI000702E528|nr:HNH endonuclease [Pedobacter sp. Leaf194]KQS36180.1 hypothetical protein ASG14_12165 [Pedobacter sp. Leaf194]
MATNLEQFRKVIFLLINLQGSVNIKEIYKAALAELQFDEHDLSYTKVNDVETSEQNWKRNLRNALQGLKDRGELVNSPKGVWRLPSKGTIELLDAEIAWELIIENAKNALLYNTNWESVKQGQLYNIEAVEHNKILIRRNSKDTLEQLYKRDVIRGIQSLNAAGGTIGRRGMNYTVAKEVTMVFLHPDLIWANDFETIQVHSITSGALNTFVKQFEEANDDDINSFQQIARRVRKGQSKLRKNLLIAYQAQCCISKTGPENVLQAAHIDPHSESGSNISTNGILLRSDLHDLFDDGLLAIEPESLIVRIHPTLANTDYYKFDGTRLSERIDILKPNKICLQRRWLKHNWTS